MSYILDALRRSEEERNRGHVPTLKTVYYDREERNLDFLHSTTGRVLVLALLLALAALLYSNRAPLLGVVDRMFGGEQQAVAEVAAPTQAAQPAPAVAASTPQQQPVAAQPQQTTQPVADQVMQAESQPVQPIPAQPAPPVQAQVTQQAAVTEPAQVSVANDQVALATPQATTGSSQRASTGDVKTKHDLPPDVMRSVPKLALSVVSFTADPKKRFVMVDSEMYYEGEEITENLIIEAITPDGPIVSWRGHEFLMQP